MILSGNDTHCQVMENWRMFSKGEISLAEMTTRNNKLCENQISVEAEEKVIKKVEELFSPAIKSERGCPSEDDRWEY